LWDYVLLIRILQQQDAAMLPTAVAIEATEQQIYSSSK
jgi:hypothetical protein